MSALRNNLVCEIQKISEKYDLIYDRVNLDSLEHAILSGSYKLSPFRIVSRPKGQPFKMDSLCYFRFKSSDDFEEYYLGIKLEDELILISLAHLLYKYVFKSNVFHEKSIACMLNKEAAIDFCYEITQWYNLRYLFVFDFSFISDTLCRKRLLEKIGPHISDSFILNLINSFLHSPILDVDGINLALNDGIPPVRFLQKVLFNFYLDDLERLLLS